MPVERAQESRDRLLPLGARRDAIASSRWDTRSRPKRCATLLEWFEDKVFAMMRPSLIVPGR